MLLDRRFAFLVACLLAASCLVDGLQSGLAVAAVLFAALAAWVWHPASARAGGVDSSGTDTGASDSTTTATESTGASESTTTTTSGTGSSGAGESADGTQGSDSSGEDDAASTDGGETGPCLTIGPCLIYYGRKSSRGATTFGGDPPPSWVAGASPRYVVVRAKPAETTTAMRPPHSGSCRCSRSVVAADAS